jgi:hypothetical protein
MAQTRPHPDDVLAWLHIGDLHVTGPDLPNLHALHAIIDEADAHLGSGVDFALLPGDNADDGAPEQFRLVREATDRLRLPLHILPGDHDFRPGGLDAFHAVLGADRLPKAIDAGGARCLFLDIVSAGRGGPCFRLGEAQTQWLRDALDQAGRDSRRVVVFMHAYPADLGDEGPELAALFARSRVAFVDTGHTHYNELANDGRTIYAAVRSTGQIEEDPAGYAVAALDGGAVSWRFKTIGSPWPFVLVTSPADRRLATEPPDASRVRALAWSGAGIVSAAFRFGDGSWRDMRPAGRPALWEAAAEPPDGPFALTVRATDASGATGEDRIEPGFEQRSRPPDGSDAHSIGAWPERGVLGTRLGPNRNGRKW